MTPVDLEPAARRLADLVAGVPDELLDAPTPCPAYTLGDLVEHVGGAASAFTGAASKTQATPRRKGPRATRPGSATTGEPVSRATWRPWRTRGATRTHGPG